MIQQADALDIYADMARYLKNVTYATTANVSKVHVDRSVTTYTYVFLSRIRRVYTFDAA